MKDSRELIRGIKFALFSVSAGILQIGITTLFLEAFGIEYWISYLVGLVASVLWNFTINRKVTFKSTANIKRSMLLVFLFYLVFTPVSTVLGNLAETNGVNEYIVLGVTMLSNLTLEYLYTRFVVYKDSCDTAVAKAVKE